MKNRRKIEYTLHLKKYKYAKIEDAEMIKDETVNELTVPIVSWIAVEKDLREIFLGILHYVQGAIEENNKTKTSEQISFEMNEVDFYKQDIQMDGVFEKYNNRRSFVEKIYCPNKYSSEIIKGATYYTKCLFKITDTNEDFDLLFNINGSPLPENYVS